MGILLAATLDASGVRAEAPAHQALHVEHLAQPAGEEPAEIVLLRVPAEGFRVRVVMAERPSLARDVAGAGILAVLNGGYFDSAGKALGLVVSDGVRIAPTARRGWGTFVIRAGRGSVHPAASTPRAVDQGIQAGPRLVVGGRAATLRSPARARRSFVGIDRSGRIVLGCAQAAITLQALADILARPASSGGADLPDALNLDGGPSTQLLVRGAGEAPELFVPGVPVPTFVVVSPSGP